MTATATVKLETPIKRGESEITAFTLRKPMGGDLRGLTIQSLTQSDYNAIRTLVPRIATPQLLETDFDTMSAADVAAFAGEILAFFMTSEQQAAIADYLGLAKSSG